MKEPGNKDYYPLMLDIEGKPCVIIGGGAVAERKVESLLEAGADVTIIAPACSEQVERWALAGRVRLIKERFRTGMREVREALLVFAATDHTEINAAVRLEAEALGKLVTIADDAARSGFIVPSVVRRGRLVIAVSTAGASPAVAKQVREELERSFGDEYEVYLELLQELRSLIKERVGATADRRVLLKSLLEWELLPWIRSGGFDLAAKQELVERLEADLTADGIKRIGDWIRKCQA